MMNNDIINETNQEIINNVITYTISTCGENHVGNQKIGEMKEGFPTKFFSKLMKKNIPEIKVYDLSAYVDFTHTSKKVEIPKQIPLAVHEKFFDEEENKNLTIEAMSISWDEYSLETKKNEVLHKAARSNTIFCYPEALSGKIDTNPPDMEKLWEEYRDFENLVKVKKQENDDFVFDDEFKKPIFYNSEYLRESDRKTIKNFEQYHEIVIPKYKKALEALEITIHKIISKNLCDKVLQYPNYQKGMGTVYNIDKLPHLKKFVEEKIIPYCNSCDYQFEKKTFVVEGNNYFNIDECYIGFHGDKERETVVGVRLGYSSMPIHYGWWINNQMVDGSLKTYYLNPGDVYFMHKKAVGRDWNESSHFTLRHCAGNLSTLLRKLALDKIIEKDNDFLEKILDKTKNFFYCYPENKKECVIEDLNKYYISEIENCKKNKVSARNKILIDSMKKYRDENLIDKKNPEKKINNDTSNVSVKTLSESKRYNKYRTYICYFAKEISIQFGKLFPMTFEVIINFDNEHCCSGVETFHSTFGVDTIDWNDKHTDNKISLTVPFNIKNYMDIDKKDHQKLLSILGTSFKDHGVFGELDGYNFYSIMKRFVDDIENGNYE